MSLSINQSNLSIVQSYIFTGKLTIVAPALDTKFPIRSLKEICDLIFSVVNEYFSSLSSFTTSLFKRLKKEVSAFMSQRVNLNNEEPRFATSKFIIPEPVIPFGVTIAIPFNFASLLKNARGTSVEYAFNLLPRGI